MSDAALLKTVRICYQPIIRLADLQADYVEVLVRAEDAHGIISGPESIVDAMDDGDRAMRFTAAIMRRALAEYGAYGFAAHTLILAFNLPLDAMLHPEPAAQIERLRLEAGLPPERIRFELTERAPVHDLAAARIVIAELRQAGYGLALDDITPDMPHLADLLAMPIRAIKLDRSIVISHSPAARSFIHAMTTQANAARQDIVAEGIETQAQHDTMLASGVTHGQGFLFSHPLSAGGLSDYLGTPHGCN
ncbi:MAG: EAL domain-containing protein [Acidocella sp.]|nr:EAL domain-containing protein [Acidocella sp.]